MEALDLGTVIELSTDFSFSEESLIVLNDPAGTSVPLRTSVSAIITFCETKTTYLSI